MNDVKLTNSIHPITIIVYQTHHQNSEFDSENKTRVVGKIFETNIKDMWLPRIICSRRIYPPTIFKYVAIE